MIDSILPWEGSEVGEEWDEVDLALLDYVEIVRAFGISRTQAVEIAAERIDELYLTASRLDQLH